jgi:hypothetical protein
MAPRRPTRQHLRLGAPQPLARYDRAEYIAWFTRTWEPENVRDLLGIAGAVLVAYELIKTRVIDDTMGFYSTGFDEDGFTYSSRYDTEVLALHNKSAYLASCAWLVKSGAISQQQVALLTELHEVRGKVTHELLGYLVDPAFTVRAGLLPDVLAVLRALVTFWVRVDMDTNPDFDGQDIPDDEISSGDLLIFEQLLVVVARIKEHQANHDAEPDHEPPSVT